MNSATTIKRRRGRPPKDQAGFSETKAVLIRSGIEFLTEKGYSATGIDEVLRQVGVPKGSFYHYFKSKEDFGLTLIKNYSAFLNHKLDKCFADQTISALGRLELFIKDAHQGMESYSYKRGCLIGNLGQEMSALPDSFREALQNVFASWEAKVEHLLKEAQVADQISHQVDCKKAAYGFWVGWEGAVLRAKLDQKPDALYTFSEFYLNSLQ